MIDRPSLTRCSNCYLKAYTRFIALAEKGNQQGMLNVAGMLAVGLGVAAGPPCGGETTDAG
jgi:hypothetical protein